MPGLLLGGSVTFAPEVPSVLNTCQTPTEGLPGSPTVATWIVTTPRFATASDAPDVVLVVVDADLWLEQAVAPITSKASRPARATRLRLMTPLGRILEAVRQLVRERGRLIAEVRLEVGGRDLDPE